MDHINNLGITVVGDMDAKKYNVTSGLRKGTLIGIEDVMEETFESRMNKEPHPPELQPVFKFIYSSTDDENKPIELSRVVSKKLSFKKVLSNLYKDIQVLIPNQPLASYQDASMVAKMITSITTSLADKPIHVLLDCEKKESGFVKVKGIHRLPAMGTQGVTPPKQTSFKDDEIPF